MPSFTEATKAFFGGGDIKHIAGSDLPAEHRIKLIRGKIFYNSLSYIFVVGGLSAVSLIINSEYQNRVLNSVEKDSATKIHSDFMKSYVSFDTVEKYHFLNMMRHTGIGSDTRLRYDSLFNHFWLSQGQYDDSLLFRELAANAKMAEQAAVERSEKVANAKKSFFVTKVDIEPSPEDSAQYIAADELQQQADELLVELESAETTSSTPEVTNFAQWSEVVRERLSFNKRLYIETFENGDLVLALSKANVTGATLEVRYKKKLIDTLELKRAVPQPIDTTKTPTGNYEITLMRTHKEGLRWYATYEVAFAEK